MKKLLYTLIVALVPFALFAGNPDRQGEPGAGELLINPWARSAGLHTMSTSCVSGVDAMHINVAGMSRINKTQILIGNTNYLSGTEIRLNSIGLAQKIGERGTLGITLTAMDFGENQVTTTGQPEGTGATFSPSFFNMGLGYSYIFQNKISVGFLVRGVSQALADISAFGIALDAGVQYVTGAKDQFKLGISLKNIGSPMRFGGNGLGVVRPASEGNYNLTYNVRPDDYELPSMLNIGISYDFHLAQALILTGVGNFTSNSFSQDQIGGGVELGVANYAKLRAGYKYEIGESENGGLNSSLDRGISAGATLSIPLKKDTQNSLDIDFAYRNTPRWGGIYNISLALNL